MRGVTPTAYEAVALPLFLLTRLMRGVTRTRERNPQYMFISTHTPHARRDREMQEKRTPAKISTHTPHARRDQPFSKGLSGTSNFYSHASCEA